MRHPLLRILAALLIGLWAPMCCCRAANVFGGVVEFGEVVGTAGVTGGAERGHCSEGCCGGSTEEGPRDEEPGRHEPGATCPSCPTCAGPMGTAGLPEVPRFVLDDATVGVTVAIATAEFSWSAHAGRGEDLGLEQPGERPRVKRANREALRWHCALVV